MSDADEQRADSAIEDLKGTAKKVAGMVTGNEDLEGEGKAQREKAEAERKAAEAREQAEQAEAEATVRAAEQKTREARKED